MNTKSYSQFVQLAKRRQVRLDECNDQMVDRARAGALQPVMAAAVSLANAEAELKRLDLFHNGVGINPEVREQFGGFAGMRHSDHGHLVNFDPFNA